MKLVGNALTKTYFQNILPSEVTEVDSVLAAIAYGSDFNNKQDLLANCLMKGVRLDLWMRYDHTVPVSVALLERLYSYQLSNVFCKFIPDCLHAKVVWWKGYGAYIGSANHTERAWMSNIELGVFISEDEMEKSGMDLELTDFFEELRACDKAIDLTPDYIKHNIELTKLNKNAFDAAEKSRKWPTWGGPAFIDKKKAHDRQKENFRSEWSSTLGILKSIEKEMPSFRPSWVVEDVPGGWLVDQFLHAYYYNHVGDSRAKPFEEYYQKNKKNSGMVLKRELEWWASLSSAPSHEYETLYTDAPLLQRILAKDKVLSITEQEFEDVCRNTHATGDYVAKVTTEWLGKPELDKLNLEARYPLFSKTIYSRRNKLGWGVGQLLNYVMYSGSDSDMWERLYNAGRTDEYRIPNYGLNSIAELSGWVRPDVAPPRNGRTSKALRALGFDVKIY